MTTRRRLLGVDTDLTNTAIVGWSYLLCRDFGLSVVAKCAETLRNLHGWRFQPWVRGPELGRPKVDTAAPDAGKMTSDKPSGSNVSF